MAFATHYVDLHLLHVPMPPSFTLPFRLPQDGEDSIRYGLKRDFEISRRDRHAQGYCQESTNEGTAIPIPHNGRMPSYLLIRLTRAKITVQDGAHKVENLPFTAQFATQRGRRFGKPKALIKTHGFQCIFEVLRQKARESWSSAASHWFSSTLYELWEIRLKFFKRRLRLFEGTNALMSSPLLHRNSFHGYQNRSQYHGNRCLSFDPLKRRAFWFAWWVLWRDAYI
ncbi:hypothetical protein BJ508DRAFT_52157 [Ascobolus immersus RN42]|uniref:Uncharacterized protein n=1 Tax=Ascobolus immersus RN42 TaxID=1160509 RepID=A0A3N4IQK8_ASCIM|nr:hypothetical protein BJ508DRAFT_52157 [Ascobolus immersus RN42]